MNIRQPLLTLIICLSLLLMNSVAVAAAYSKSAAEASDAKLNSYSIYVDINFGMRKRMAADELNKAHEAFSKKGYEVVAVVSHVENGDLLGFFITYRKIKPE
jgi:ribosomal protein S1